MPAKAQLLTQCAVRYVKEGSWRSAVRDSWGLPFGAASSPACEALCGATSTGGPFLFTKLGWCWKLQSLPTRGRKGAAHCWRF